VTILTLTVCLLASLASGDSCATLTEIDHPSAEPPKGASFGFATAILDYDGDGKADIAVGAPGEEKVYVFFGDGFERHITLEPGEAKENGGFGCALAAGAIDEVPGDELAVGANKRRVGEKERAGMVFVFGRGLVEPIVMHGKRPAPNERLGEALAVGDYDDDGLLEVAAGAPGYPGEGAPGGKVYVFQIDGEGAVEQGVFENHQRVPNAHYGHDLGRGDWNGDGVDDLFVSAPGNDNRAGRSLQGQMVIHLGPFREDGCARETVIVEDNVPNADEPGGRFGMSIAARGRVFAVGAPRKDVGETVDGGMGFVFRDDEEPLNLWAPEPIENGILGYRARIGDFVGDEALDVAFVSLPQGMYIWEMGRLAEPIFVSRPRGGCPHWASGIAVGQVYPGGKEEIVLGGFDWEPEGFPSDYNSGRAHIVRFR